MVDYRRIWNAVALAGFCCCSAGAPALVVSADEVREALVRDLRIGFVRPSGDVVWPVETLDEPRRFALPLWSKEREARRRRWTPDLQPAPESVGKVPLRLSIGATVSVLHDGHTYGRSSKASPSCGQVVGTRNPVGEPEPSRPMDPKASTQMSTACVTRHSGDHLFPTWNRLRSPSSSDLAEGPYNRR